MVVKNLTSTRAWVQSSAPTKQTDNSNKTTLSRKEKLIKSAFKNTLLITVWNMNQKGQELSRKIHLEDYCNNLGQKPKDLNKSSENGGEEATSEEGTEEEGWTGGWLDVSSVGNTLRMILGAALHS